MREQIHKHMHVHMSHAYHPRTQHAQALIHVTRIVERTSTSRNCGKKRAGFERRIFFRTDVSRVIASGVYRIDVKSLIKEQNNGDNWNKRDSLNNFKIKIFFHCPCSIKKKICQDKHVNRSRISSAIIWRAFVLVIISASRRMDISSTARRSRSFPRSVRRASALRRKPCCFPLAVGQNAPEEDYHEGAISGRARRWFLMRNYARAREQFPDLIIALIIDASAAARATNFMRLGINSASTPYNVVDQKLLGDT